MTTTVMNNVVGSGGKRILHFVNLQGMSILRQLQLEEAILRHTNLNMFMVNTGMTGKAIVMGFSGKPLELLDIDKVNRDNIPVIRRYTGGGTVIVDHTTFFASIVHNEKEAATRPYPREIMTWTADFVYTPTFHSCMTHSPAETQFKLLEHDYVIGDKKIGGNAQTITKDRWVHHTSFLWDYDESNMEYLQLPKKRPEYRQSRKHSDFLQKIKYHIPSLPLFTDTLVQQLRTVYDEVQVLSVDEVLAIEQDVFQQHPSFQARTKLEVV